MAKAEKYPFIGEISANEWNFVVGEQTSLLAKLEKMPIKLKDVSGKNRSGYPHQRQ